MYPCMQMYKKLSPPYTYEPTVPYGQYYSLNKSWFSLQSDTGIHFGWSEGVFESCRGFGVMQEYRRGWSAW